MSEPMSERGAIFWGWFLAIVTIAMYLTHTIETHASGVLAVLRGAAVAVVLANWYKERQSNRASADRMLGMVVLIILVFTAGH